MLIRNQARESSKPCQKRRSKPGSGINPKTHSGCGSSGVLGGDPDAIVQHGDLGGWHVQEMLLKSCGTGSTLPDQLKPKLQQDKLDIPTYQY